MQNHDLRYRQEKKNMILLALACKIIDLEIATATKSTISLPLANKITDWVICRRQTTQISTSDGNTTETTPTTRNGELATWPTSTLCQPCAEPCANLVPTWWTSF